MNRNKIKAASDRPAFRQTDVGRPVPGLAIVYLWPNLLHVAAALLHALVRSDGVFDVMAPVSSDDEVAPAKSLWRRRL
jgi:hypothetical protein